MAATIASVAAGATRTPRWSASGTSTRWVSPPLSRRAFAKARATAGVTVVSPVPWTTVTGTWLCFLLRERERVGLSPSLRALGPAAVEEAAQERRQPQASFVQVDRTGEGDQRVRPQRAAGGVAGAFGRRDLFRRQGDHRAGPAAERVTDQDHAVRVAAVVRPDRAGHADGAGDVLERRRPAAALVPVLPPDGVDDHGVVHGDRETGVHDVALVGQRVGPAGDEQHHRSGARCRRCQHVHRELTGGADVVAGDVGCERHAGPARQLGGRADVAAAGVDREDLVRGRGVAAAGRGSASWSGRAPVVLSVRAGPDVASDDPPPQPAREALARTPASTQATRRRRVMPLIRPRSGSRDSNDLAAVRCRQLCAMSTKRE